MLLPNPLNIVIYVFILKVCVMVNLYLCGREFNEKFLKFHIHSFPVHRMG